MKKAKYLTPLDRLARFKNTNEINIILNGAPTWMTFSSARELRDMLGEMLDGDLKEVRKKDCCCLERVYVEKKTRGPE